jgi:hypothetical protein
MAKQKHKNPPSNKSKNGGPEQHKLEWDFYSILKFFFIAATGLQLLFINF